MATKTMLIRHKRQIRIPLVLSRRRFPGTVFIKVDNQAAVKWSELKKLSQRNRHYGTRFKRLRELNKSGEIKLIFVKGEFQVADIFTKALGPTRFRMLCGHLGVISRAVFVDLLDQPESEPP